MDNNGQFRVLFLHAAWLLSTRYNGAHLWRSKELGEHDGLAWFICSNVSEIPSEIEVGQGSKVNIKQLSVSPSNRETKQCAQQ